MYPSIQTGASAKRMATPTVFARSSVSSTTSSSPNSANGAYRSCPRRDFFSARSTNGNEASVSPRNRLLMK